MTLLNDPLGWWASLGRPFRHLSRPQAIAALAALLLALVWASVATSSLQQVDDARVAAKEEGIGDIRLYELIHERVATGESYYAAAVEEQRENDYPTRPFVTVRLPTLAYVDMVTSDQVWKGIALALTVVSIMAWLGLLEPLGLTRVERGLAAFMLFMCGLGLFLPDAQRFHELVSGMLLTVALGVYRPQRWWPSLLFAAAALTIRELALPFLLLWAVFAASQKSWRECAAIGLVVALFFAGMALHAAHVAEYVLPGDKGSPGWDGLSGPQLALYSLARLTPLLYTRMDVAAPIALLPLLGWFSLGGRTGLFASLWFVGMFTAMALFARLNNFYWVLLVLPAYAAGMAFVPRALAELVSAARGGQKSLS